ncbi:60S ribosomal export protein NMD3 [Nematocida homosporus]|uniref:60S ribosomal export protein NMD3 n=1 Tax=Nematocida homosporus TaxID=1912981 RepID=UPI0022205F01|nr:60S ribosomal export protein NMD3 [Nematocida homosporus]KAI5186263.1 60S ribosomal export protein NMD3 [Nematocida homosporus]
MRCCLCGGISLANQSMCGPCGARELPNLAIQLKRSVDRCSTCLRYSMPPSSWVALRFEGPEMLAYLLRAVAELNKLSLVDARFIHAESHSKRLHVAVQIDRSGELGAPYTEEVLLEWKIIGKHCLDCARAASNQTWSSVVQLRQKASGKKTLLGLEAAVVKAGLHTETTDIKGVADGIDFFFKGRTPALRLVRFLEGIVPCRLKISEQLVKMDKKSNDSRYKFAYSVEVPGLDEDDLILLPEEAGKDLGCLRVTAVLRVGRSVVLADANGRVVEMGKEGYFRWARDIKVVSLGSKAVEMEVVEVERSSAWRDERNGLAYGANRMTEVVVVRPNGELADARTYVTNLRPGEVVLAHDLSTLHTEEDLAAVFVLKRAELGSWRLYRRSTAPVPSPAPKISPKAAKRARAKLAAAATREAVISSLDNLRISPTQ